METYKILGLAIIGTLWLSGVISYAVACIKTKTWPCQMSDDDLFRKAFGSEKKEMRCRACGSTGPMAITYETDGVCRKCLDEILALRGAQS